LGGADGGVVAGGAGADNDDVEGLGHVMCSVVLDCIKRKATAVKRKIKSFNSNRS